MAERIMEHREIDISLSLADALVLDSFLTRYQDVDPQTFSPNASEYAALMHIAGALERWFDGGLEVPADKYESALAEAYDDLGDPAGYRGNAPAGPPRS